MARQHSLRSKDIRIRTLSLSPSLSVSLSLSVLTAIFQVNPGKPVFIVAKDDGGGGNSWTTGAISRVKLQSNHHHQQTNIQFFYRPDTYNKNTYWGYKIFSLLI